MTTTISFCHKFTINPKPYECFNFLICFNAKKMQTIHLISEKRAKLQILNQIFILNIFKFGHKYVAIIFFFFILYLAIDSISSNQLIASGFIFYLIALIKLIVYSLFYISFKAAVLRVHIV